MTIIIVLAYPSKFMIVVLIYKGINVLYNDQLTKFLWPGVSTYLNQIIYFFRNDKKKFASLF